MGLFSKNQKQSKMYTGYIFKISFHAPKLAKFQKIVTFSLEQILIKNSELSSIAKKSNVNFRLDDKGLLQATVTFSGFKKEKYSCNPLYTETKEQYINYVKDTLQKANFTFTKFDSFSVLQENGETITIPF